MAESPKRIVLWSGPVTIATAMMYAFAQREDTSVFDEPLYAHYLSKTDARFYHPGADEVIASQKTDGRQMIEDVFLGNHGTPIIFIKSMAHHLVDLDWRFLNQMHNVILTRHPEDLLRGYITHMKSPKLKDTGYLDHIMLWEYLQSIGQDPPVIDTGALLRNPEKVLRELCLRLDIPFSKAMLSWEPGPRPEDGIWAKYWYERLHNASDFSTLPKPDTDIPEGLSGLINECKPYYNELLSYAIRDD